MLKTTTMIYIDHLRNVKTLSFRLNSESPPLLEVNFLGCIFDLNDINSGGHRRPLVMKNAVARALHLRLSEYSTTEWESRINS